MTKIPQLRIVPDSVVFRDVMPGESESCPLSITNVGNAPIKIRFVLPIQSPFRLTKDGTVTAAPGIEFKQNVKFKPDECKTYQDTIKLDCQGQIVEIPVVAYPSSPRFIINKESIDLGTMGIGSSATFSFDLTNIGSTTGHFRIVCDNPSVKFLLTSGELESADSLEISGSFAPQVVDDWEISVSIQCDEALEPIPPLILRAKSVKSGLSLTFKDEPAEELDFGTLYFGQKRSLKTILKNESPYKRSFVVMPPKSIDGSDRTNRAVFQAMPSEGFMDPNSSVVINFTFCPPYEAPTEEDFETMFLHSSSIELVETQQRVDIRLTGKAVHHIVDLDCLDFDFERQEVGSKTTKSLTIKNMSQFLPTSFEMKEIASYRFEPMKGAIKANGEAIVQVTFFPRAYGNFDATGHIVFAGGLDSKHFNVVGTCVSAIQDKPFVREPIYEREASARFSLQHPDRKYQFTIEELELADQRKKVYDSWIGETARVRQKRHAQKELLEKTKKMIEQTGMNYTRKELLKIAETNESNDVNLGLGHYEGMTPPDPPLHTRNPRSGERRKMMGMDQGEQAMNRFKAQFDENILMPKKFKAKPTTPTEVSECAMQITPSQQMQIISSHQTITFGEVSVFSKVAKCFAISNGLQQSILVSMNFEHEELSESGPTAQVIPAKQNAGFDIVFSSKKPCTFNKTIEYTINGKHKHSLTIIAVAVPIEVQLSRNVIEFRFGHDSVMPFVKEYITLQNKSSTTAKFSWAGANDQFTLSVPMGVIEANKTRNIEVTYIPKEQSRDEATLTLSVEGGPSRILKCVGLPGNPKCQLLRKKVDFGVVALGMEVTQTVKVKNSSDDDAIFTLCRSAMPELTIVPNSGRIAGRDVQTFTITLNSSKVYSFEVPVTIEIAGAHSLGFTVSGQVELPQVRISNNEFYFGKLYVGSTSAIDGVIENVGSIPAVLLLDLYSKPEFKLEYAPELASHNENEKCNAISLVSDPCFVTTGVTRTTMTEEQTKKSVTETKPQNGLIYRILIMENSSIPFKLVYQPSEVNEHSFELPFALMNVETTSGIHLQPIVSGEAVRAPLRLSVQSLDFGIAPIYDPQNPHYRAIARTVTVTSDQKKPTKWRFDVKKDSVFLVEPKAGTLSYNENQTIHITFLPKASTPYCDRLPIYAVSDSGDEESLISTIQLVAVGTCKNFDVSLSEVCLPTVPLGVRSESMIYVMNNSFIESELRIEFPFDAKTFPVSISFPEGNCLQHTTKSLPLLISFESSKPVSFSTVVGLVDNHGNATSFTVTCTADNSVFTLYPFLNKQQGKISSGGGGKPIKLACDKTFTKYELMSKFLSVKDYLDLELNDFKPSVSTGEIEYFVRYLNTFVVNTPINAFPGDFIRTEGALLSEALVNLTGGKKSSGESYERNQEQGPSDPIVKKREAMRKILASLQSYGALLGSVRPEFLLSRADFLYLMRMKVARQLIGMDYFNAPDVSTVDQSVLADFISSNTYSNNLVARMKVLEAVFDDLSMEAWTMVIMQLVKVFVLIRVDGDKLGKLPGVANVLKQVKSMEPSDLVNEVNRPGKNLSLSNVFSLHECALLKWASLFSASVIGRLDRTVTDFADLRNGVAIAALISRYSDKNIDVNTSTSDQLGWEANAVAIATLMKEMKMNFCPSPHDILNGSRIMLALLLEFLYEALPHYLPKALIEFTTPLHKVVTRSFSVANTSKAEITYVATLSDHVNFELPTDSIVVAPNSSADFQIQFFARTVKPVAARVELIPSRPRMIGAEAPKEKEKTAGPTPCGSARGSPVAPVFSAPIVVDLRTNVTFQKPDECLSMEGVLYQNSALEIPVKNLLRTPSKLEIRQCVSVMVDENGQTLQQTPLPQLLKEMVEHGDFQENDSDPGTGFDAMLKRHKTFILSTSRVEFHTRNPDETVNVELEFMPISLGTFRCLLLFIDEMNGEFVIEVTAKTLIPAATEILRGKLKAESGQKCTQTAPVDFGNSLLVKAVAYSQEKYAMVTTYQNERTFRDMLARRNHDVDVVYKQSVTSGKFAIVNSSPEYFNTPPEVLVMKGGGSSEMKKSANNIPVTFKPGKAGEYPCRLLLVSKYDVRVLQMTAIGIAATKEVSLEFSTAAGKSVKQELPLQNPSTEVWNFKITCSGDDYFSAPQRVSVKPQSTGYLPITFSPFKVGTYTGTVTVVNLNKESTVVYQLSGSVDEPPAEQKIVLNCQARQKLRHKIDLKPFVKNGTITVTTTVPIIAFDKQIVVTNEQLMRPFEFTVVAQRSGLAAGTLTFTDEATQSYLWYVLEIHVDPPPPEETIEIQTTARKTATVSIPIANPKSQPVSFSVAFSDDDIFGEMHFTVPAKSHYDYALVVSPIKAMKRRSSVFFYSEDDGEFWYSLQIVATEPPENTLAQLTCPIGKYASTFILLENPGPKHSMFRVENDNMLAFQVMAKTVIQIPPHDKKRVELRYIPNTVGTKESATISFHSSENGDWIYKVSGMGKPPQPLSPVIVSSTVDSPSSALVLFNNPFPYPSRFSVSLSSDNEDLFSFLVKRKVFTLNSYGEEFQIAFSFTPKELGQFNGFIVVSSLGPARGPLPDLESASAVRWVYPIIGNAVSSASSEARIIGCRAQETAEQTLDLTLVGETDAFTASEYAVTLSLPQNMEFLRSAITTTADEVQRTSNATTLIVRVRFAPQKPVQCESTVKVSNPLGQEWQFQVTFFADRGKPVDTITIESLLNKEGTARVFAPVSFGTPTQFKAYFAPGSATEFRLSVTQGVIPISLDEKSEVPVDIIFAPKMYGKLLRGVLVIETAEAQYLYDIIGKTPDYVPPVVKKSGILNFLPEDARKYRDTNAKKRRNIIRDNIEKVRTMRPNRA